MKNKSTKNKYKIILLFILFFVPTFTILNSYLYPLVFHHSTQIVEDETKHPSTKVTALMLHSVCDIEGSVTIISEKKLENLLQYIVDNDLNTVSQKELLDYVYAGIDLPENPVVLTFDDGYYNNYTTVFPLLKKYHQKAIFFPIGISNGKDVYRNTDIEIYKHYGNKEIAEMMASGLIDFGSHTYDLHRVKKLEPNCDKVRISVLKLDNETEEEYKKAMQEDFKKFKDEFNNFADYDFVAFSYPLGEHDNLSEELVWQAGFKISFTVNEGYNYVKKGVPESLLCLNRINISEMSNFEEIFKK